MTRRFATELPSTNNAAGNRPPDPVVGGCLWTDTSRIASAEIAGAQNPAETGNHCWVGGNPCSAHLVRRCEQSCLVAKGRDGRPSATPDAAWMRTDTELVRPEGPPRGPVSSSLRAPTYPGSAGWERWRVAVLRFRWRVAHMRVASERR